MFKDDSVLRNLQLEIIQKCGVLILHGSLVYDTKYLWFHWVYVDIWSLFIKWHDAGEEDHCVFPKGTLTPETEKGQNSPQGVERVNITNPTLMTWSQTDINHYTNKQTNLGGFAAMSLRQPTSTLDRWERFLKATFRPIPRRSGT